MKEGADTGFRVDSLKPSGKGEEKCSCGSCGWQGKEKNLRPIVGCALKAGERVPAGRCPTCGSVVVPHTDDDIRQALSLLEQLVSMDEMLRKGRSVDYKVYGDTLKAAKRAAKRGLALLKQPATADAPGEDATGQAPSVKS